MKIEMEYCCELFLPFLEGSRINLEKQTLKIANGKELTHCPFCGTKIKCEKLKLKE